MQFRKCTLVDLLNRVLDRGLFMDADLVIFVADIPLVAARLKLAISSVETMVSQGLLEPASMRGAGAVARP